MIILKSHKELEVYQMAYRNAMMIYNLTKSFPKEEIYGMTSQIRNSSRSVAANIAEAFRKRRYEKAFVAKLSDSEAEAAETQTWLEFAFDCGYIDQQTKEDLATEYEHIIGKLVNMIKSPHKWSF